MASTEESIADLLVGKFTRDRDKVFGGYLYGCVFCLKLFHVRRPPIDHDKTFRMVAHFQMCKQQHGKRGG